MPEINAALLQKIEDTVLSSLPRCADVPALREMMLYSLESGGKRVRPRLCLMFCAAAGGDPANALHFAAAVEYVHTYSLIHDDLPCMDNDDFRRGKPSSHVRFGEANALLAGDALLTHAFYLAAEAAVRGEVRAEDAVRAVSELSDLAGANGMVGGQVIDLAAEGGDVPGDTLFTMDRLKTGALIRCACLLGCIAADAEIEQIDAAETYADNLGVAFQIVDDILDVTADSATLGKPVGSDEKNGKNTYVSLLGLDGAGREAEDYTNKALAALDVFGERAEDLKRFTAALLERKK